MYHPYFRGKQFELIAIRESAELIASAGFTPIIEPVREALGGLERTLGSLVAAGAQAIVVVNPRHGHHRGNGDSIAALLERDYRDNDAIGAGILLRSDTTLPDAAGLLSTHPGNEVAVLHAGFTDARGIAEALDGRMEHVRNVFIDGEASRLYRRHFADSTRILIRDGFERQRNADYGEVDSFSDLHITYTEEGMDGYGDFLTVGDVFSENGGPAYAVAIHLTFIDPAQDDAMFVYHFVSDTNDTPTDPAGKFAQALAKLIRRLDSGRSNLLETRAITEFRDLHARGHFPGLGHVKKLSMIHHLETLANFHGQRPNA
ncbi:sce7725 family protein [Mycolicibacterium sphagni]|uniref:ATP-binding protein n=1 Tax=Mycolicibacterium sphagni TaxID=1786 RepID=A0A255DD51_9MYCO|nr:sce7725 family protein [Mycolicibacterium sphagni]OYN77040.1 ATP-binding protein [Mycolicibacterium sphagni]